MAPAVAWRDVPAYPLVKFALTGTVTCPICCFLAGRLLRVRWIRSVR